MARPAVHAADAPSRGLPQEIQIAAAEVPVGEYGTWRSGLDGFRQRAALREEACRLIEAQGDSLERRRAEARDRRELEDQRRREAEARAEQRRREAAEYSAWRADAVLARRAEERTRTAEHIQWRDHLTKLKSGVAVEGISLSQKPVEGDPWKRPGIFDVSPRGSAETGVAGDVLEETERRLNDEESWEAMVRQNKEAIRKEREQSKAEAARRSALQERARILGTAPAAA